MPETEQLTQVSGRGPVRRLEIKISIAADINRVWNALTVSDQVKHWWTEGTIEPEEGGTFKMENGEEVNGTVKLCHKPYLFEFTWNDSPGQAGHPHLIDPNTKSTVRFDLVELGDDCTALTFIQYLPPDEVVGAAAGWHQIVGERLPSYITTGSVPDNPNRFPELVSIYEAAGIS